MTAEFTPVQQALLGIVGDALRELGVRPRSTPDVAADAVPLSSQDTSELVRLARLHGVSGLLPDRVIETAPVNVRTHARAFNDTVTRRSMVLCAELRRVIGLLEAAHIPAIVLKGPVLAQRLYGGVTRRTSWDLDLLLPRERIGAATALLLQDGYLPEEHWSPRRARRELRRNCERNFDHPERGVHVELHWRFTPRHIGFRYNERDLWARSEHATFMGARVRVLGFADELLSVAVHHGGKHAWEQLRMIADIGVFALRCGADRALEVTEQAERAGVKRILAAGLVLAHELLSVPLDDTLRSWAYADPSALGVVDYAARRLFRFTGDSQGDGLPQLRYYVLTRERLSDRLRYLPYAAASVFTPTEQEPEWLPLPSALHPLYVVLRPVRLIAKYYSSLQPKQR